MSYVSSYPSPLDTTTCKATSYAYNVSEYAPWNAFNPATSLSGDQDNNVWLSGGPIGQTRNTDQRLHVDLGSAVTVVRIYYQNYHSTGGSLTFGVRNFTFWGSNDSGSFAELTYATDTGWTQLTAAAVEFDKHAAVNGSDPKYMLITNVTPYRYYAIKCADNWGHGTFMGFRRVELQYDDAPVATPTTTGHSTGAHWYHKKHRRRYNDQDPFKSNK
jgi:hypothetical protein